MSRKYVKYASPHAQLAKLRQDPEARNRTFLKQPSWGTRPEGETPTPTLGNIPNCGVARCRTIHKNDKNEHLKKKTPSPKRNDGKKKGLRDMPREHLHLTEPKDVRSYVRLTGANLGLGLGYRVRV